MKRSPLVPALMESLPDEPWALLERAAALDRFDATAFVEVLEGDEEAFLAFVASHFVQPDPCEDGTHCVVPAVRPELRERLAAEDLRKLVERANKTQTSVPEALRIALEPEAAFERMETRLLNALQSWDVARAYVLIEPFRVARDKLGPRLNQRLHEHEAALQTRDLWAGAYHDTINYRPTAVTAELFERFQRATDRPWLLQIFGRGGRGKSMFVKKVIARDCVSASLPVARIDFDFVEDIAAFTRTEEPLLEEIHRQFELQLGPDRSGPVQSAMGADTKAGPGIGAAPTAKDLGLKQGADRRASHRLEALLREHRVWDAVVVLDTVEQILKVREATPLVLLQTLHALRETVGGLKVILAGRFDLLSKIHGRPRVPGIAAFARSGSMASVRLMEFSPEEAELYLLEQRGLELSQELRDTIVELSGGSPMHLSLFADLVEDRPELSAEELKRRGSVAEYYLHDRILERIPDRRLRWVVLWGVVPARLDRRYLREVLTPRLEALVRAGGQVAPDAPFALVENTDFDADELWDGLQHFVSTESWIEMAPSREALRFHPDAAEPLRELLLQRSDPEQWAGLHEATAAHYLERAEEADDQTRWNLGREALGYAYAHPKLRETSALLPRIRALAVGRSHPSWVSELADTLAEVAPGHLDSARLTEEATVAEVRALADIGDERALQRAERRRRGLPVGPLARFLEHEIRLARTGSTDVGELIELLEECDEALAQDVRWTLARALVRTDPSAALEALSSAEASDLDSEDLRRARVRRLSLLREAERFGEAVALAEQIASGDGDPHLEALAEVLAEAGQLDRALSMGAPEAVLRRDMIHGLAALEARDPDPLEQMRLEVARVQVQRAELSYERLRGASSRHRYEDARLLWAQLCLDEVGDVKRAAAALEEVPRISRLARWRVLRAVADRRREGPAVAMKSSLRLPSADVGDAIAERISGRHSLAQLLERLEASLSAIDDPRRRVVVLDGLRWCPSPEGERASAEALLALLPDRAGTGLEAKSARLCAAEILRVVGDAAGARAMLEPLLRHEGRAVLRAWARAGGDLPDGVTDPWLRLDSLERSYRDSGAWRAELERLEQTSRGIESRTSWRARIEALKAFAARDSGEGGARELAERASRRFEALGDHASAAALAGLLEQEVEARPAPDAPLTIRADGGRDGRWVVTTSAAAGSRSRRVAMAEHGSFLRAALAARPGAVPSVSVAQLVEEFRSVGHDLARALGLQSAHARIALELSTPQLDWIPWELMHPPGRAPLALREGCHAPYRRTHKAPPERGPGPVLIYGNRDEDGLESLSASAGASLDALYRQHGLVFEDAVESHALGPLIDRLRPQVVHLVGRVDEDSDGPLLRVGSAALRSDDLAALAERPCGLLVLDGDQATADYDQAAQILTRLQLVADATRRGGISDCLCIGPMRGAQRVVALTELVSGLAAGRSLELIAAAIRRLAAHRGKGIGFANSLPLLTTALFTERPDRVVPVEREE